jgi:hypothetical protein
MRVKVLVLDECANQFKYKKALFGYYLQIWQFKNDFLYFNLVAFLILLALISMIVKDQS